MEGATRGWGSPTEVAAASGAGGGGGGGGGVGRRALLGGGWRRRALYAILATLMCVVFLNIGLTLWILTVLQFSADGIGPIRIIRGGIQLNGRALVTEALVATSLFSRPGQPLALESYRNFTINVRGTNGQLESQLTVKRSGVEVSASSFHIRDALGRRVFSAEAGEVWLGGSSLTLVGEGGLRVDSSVQTPAVRADAGHDLVLESPTRTLEVRAPQSIVLESRAGAIAANALQDISFVSAAGSVQLDAANVYIRNLTEARWTGAPPPPPPTQHAQRPPRLYQLCACADGKLFVAPPDGLCQTYDGDDVCR